MWEMDKKAEELATLIVTGTAASDSEREHIDSIVDGSPANDLPWAALLWATYKLAVRRRAQWGAWATGSQLLCEPFLSERERWRPGEMHHVDARLPKTSYNVDRFSSPQHCARLIAYAALGLGGPQDAMDALELARTTDEWRRPARVAHIMERPPEAPPNRD